MWGFAFGDITSPYRCNSICEGQGNALTWVGQAMAAAQVAVSEAKALARVLELLAYGGDGRGWAACEERGELQVGVALQRDVDVRVDQVGA